MRIHVNAKYKHLQEWFEHIDEHFENEGREIYNDRNVLRVIQHDGYTFCVKRFAPPTMAGRIANRIYRASKGKKAYISPILLRERGFESPEPVAFVRYKHGLLKATESYFVCLQSDFAYSMEHLDKVAPEKQEEVIKQFAEYAAHLHEQGFLHRDFSPSNILFDFRRDRWHFQLIDTNSMKCGRAVSLKKGCQNFCRLQGDNTFFTTLAKHYATARKADPAHVEALILAARDKYQDKVRT